MKKVLFVLLAAVIIIAVSAPSFRNTNDSNRPSFEISVDNMKPIKEMIKMGKYDYIDADINKKNFPESYQESGDIRVELFKFDISRDYNFMIKEMEKEGYRPATATELLALGAKYPFVQEKYPVIALGSVWKNKIGLRRVVGLDYKDMERRVLVYWTASGFDPGCRFAAVKKD